MIRIAKNKNAGVYAKERVSIYVTIVVVDL